MNASVCAEPPDFSVLIDYWINELPPSLEERIEEHLLGCATCSASMGDLVALIGAVRNWGTGADYFESFLAALVLWRHVKGYDPRRLAGGRA